MKIYSIVCIALTAISISCAYIYASNNHNNHHRHGHNQNHHRQGKTMIQTGDILDLSTFQKGPEGILYKVVTPAPEGAKKPLRGEQAEVHYSGYNLKILNNVYTITNPFDNSYDRGRPFMFQVGGYQVIKGWELMIADMQEGETRIVILPAAVAYGSRGAGQQILPGATLVFTMNLVKIR